MTYGGITFRAAINNNKRKIVEFLSGKNHSYTSDIEKGYGGEKGMATVRKALNELREEGTVTTDDHVHFWRGKKWRLVKQVNQ